MKKLEIITIDGAAGEGGGQILRTALALSMVTGQPFRMIHIRAGRKKPGLLRQHLTAAQAACAICGGVADGLVLSSTELVFRPGKVQPGSYAFAVGTAGSTTLVLQTILPALMLAGAPSQVSLEGGTHNPAAPTFDFLAKTFLPALARFGPQVAATLIRPGFFPAGGGRMEIVIEPVTQLQPVDFHEQGEITHRRATALLAGLPESIGRREIAHLQERLSWPEDCFGIAPFPEAYGPGNVLIAEIGTAAHTEVFSGFGERGVRSEAVADALIRKMRHYLKSHAPVGEYLADQLLLPLALAGSGGFRASTFFQHARTNLEVIQFFLPVRFSVTESEAGGSLVQVHAGKGADAVSLHG